MYSMFLQILLNLHHYPVISPTGARCQKQNSQDCRSWLGTVWSNNAQWGSLSSRPLHKSSVCHMSRRLARPMVCTWKLLLFNTWSIQLPTLSHLVNKLTSLSMAARCGISSGAREESPHCLEPAHQIFFNEKMFHWRNDHADPFPLCVCLSWS